MHKAALAVQRHCKEELRRLLVGLCQDCAVSVCVSVKSHLTSGTPVRPENTVTYSAGNGGQNICGVFSENTSFKKLWCYLSCCSLLPC